MENQSQNIKNEDISRVSINPNGYAQFLDEDDIENHRKINSNKQSFSQASNIKVTNDQQSHNIEQQSQSQEGTSQESQNDKQQLEQFMRALLQVISPEEGEKLKQMFMEIPQDDLRQMGGSMGNVTEEQLQQQVQIFTGMTAEQIMQQFQEMSKMDPKEAQQMQEQMNNMDEKDIQEMKAMMEMGQEIEKLKKPYRWLLEYGFFGFKVHTITFYMSLLMTFVYVYVQRIFLQTVSGKCQYALAGAAVPSMIVNDNQYFRIFTSAFVFGSYYQIFFQLNIMFFVFFMIERIIGSNGKFILLLLFSQISGVLSSINFQPDQIVYGISSTTYSLTVLFFFICWKHKKEFLKNKFYIGLTGSYLIYFLWQIFLSNPDKLAYHIGSCTFGLLIQPFIFNMNYKLSNRGKYIYEVLIAAFFITQLALMYLIPITPGPNTQNLLKTCPGLNLK